VALAALAATVFGACTSSAARQAAVITPTTTTTSTTSTTSTSTTTTAPPQHAPTPEGLQRGSTGEQVRQLEQRLADLHFDPGKVDGSFDAVTGHAVTAFQKVWGMERTGRATDDVLTKLSSVGDPEPMLGAGGANRVEVDLKRQVLFLWKDGALLRILPVSTGSGKRYCVDGGCAKAITPGGSFKVNRKIHGLRVSRLGKLYNPLYFNGGIAIHGAPSVPAYPASHGCVRIPMNASQWFYDTVQRGTPVYVVGGPKAPVPFDEQAPPDGADQATTTTAPATTVPPTTVTTTPPATTTTTAPPPTSTTSTTAPPPPIP
jgi:peptidoglycan hydrolase-like protein with peptidoglycan-binding domain